MSLNYYSDDRNTRGDRIFCYVNNSEEVETSFFMEEIGK